MDLRAKSDEVELYNSWSKKLKCTHDKNTGKIVDTEIIRLDLNTIEVHEIRICPKGHYFRVYSETHQDNFNLL